MRTALGGGKVPRLQVGTEHGKDRVGEFSEGAAEWRGLPAPRVGVKAHRKELAREGFEAEDRRVGDLDVQIAPCGPDGDVIVPPISPQGGGQHAGVLREDGGVRVASHEAILGGAASAWSG